MQTIRKILDHDISAAIRAVTGEGECPAIVIPASRPAFGDYQANGIMSVAKRIGAKPRDIADKVCASLHTGEMIERVEVAGPGFINIHLSADWLGNRARMTRQNFDELIPVSAAPARVVVDYSSPNLAKEMHVGHLRSTIIGDSLARVLSRLGHEVIRQNHVGDWGTQFGMLIAFLRLETKDLSEVSGELADLEAFYRAAKQRFDADPAFAEMARAEVVKLQGGDAQSLAMWEQFIDESLRHCEQVYALLNIQLTRADLRPESFYNNKLQDIINVLSEKELLTISAGAQCVFLPDFKGKDGEPLPVIVQKSDGGYLYATTDLAAVRYRIHDLEVDRVLYVVDARQSLHFQQIFAVARAAGFADADSRLEHIPFGTMMGTDGKPFATRSGGIVKLIDLLHEAQKRALEVVTVKNPDLDDTTKQDIARKVGIGAVKYADLSKNRTSDYVFDWNSMLAFEGNTAPYLLYAYTRIKKHPA